MKVVLDITRLVQEGKLTAEQAEHLKGLAARDTSALAINVLLSFGAVAVAAGVLALQPYFATSVLLGGALVLIGFLVLHFVAEHWRLLGLANVTVGALFLSGGVIGLLDGHFAGFLAAAILLLSLAIIIRSGFLIALAPLALFGALGSSTGYFHASYMLIVREPTITVVFFSLLAGIAYLISKRAAPDRERLAIIFARVSLVLVNFGFCVGSLWGDYPGQSWLHAKSSAANEQFRRAVALHIPDLVFVGIWAAAIIGVGIWAARSNRRWVVNTAATFGAIHFYTQWFERLGLNPVGIIVAGLIVVGIAVVLWRYNSAHHAARNPG